MESTDGHSRGESIAELLRQMQHRLDTLPPDNIVQRLFLDTYRRTTAAVAAAIDGSSFEDPAWVEQWDVVFGGFYLQALDNDLAGGVVSRPWRLAFDAPSTLPPLRHVLLGINAHINFDLPQALLAVITDDQFDDSAVVARRRRDHQRIDAVLSGRVAAEDRELSARSTRTLLDRALRPLNRAASARFLKEARQKVWHNTLELHRARVTGTAALEERIAELEVLSAAKIADLLAPGQVLLRLSVSGFGVLLPPPR